MAIMSSAGDETVVHGVAGIVNDQAIANQNAALGHQEELLRSLMTGNTALYYHLSTLTERVTQLASRASPPPPVVVPAPVVNPVLPAKEPHVPTPEWYSGGVGSSQAFITQVSLVFDL